MFHRCFDFGRLFCLGLSLISWGVCASERAETSARTVANFALLDHQGAFRDLYYLGRDPAVKAIVLFVHGTGCPLVQKRVPELNQLASDLKPEGVVFWMINANSQDDRAEIKAEAESFGIQQPILIDDTQLVAEALDIKRTAEAILIEPRTWKIRYRGAISDRLGFQAEKPQEVSREYLREAIQAVLKGEPVTEARTASPGCRVTLTDSDEADHRTISYTRTIAPLLVKRCADCHSKGGLGPFAMSSYEKVRGWAEMMEEVVLTRQMPPWQGDPHTGPFANDFSLTPAEKKSLVHWIRAGAKRDAGADPLLAYQRTEREWQLGPPDKIIALETQSVPAEGVIEYRYITIDSPFADDVWVRAVEVNPGNTRVLHHVIVTSHPAGEGGKNKEKSLAGYAPGTGPDVFPPGSGVLLRAGSRIRFQLHYTASGKPETDTTRLGLYLAKEPAERELHTGVVIESKFKIPPGAAEYSVSRTNVIKQDVLLHAMNPHMHFRGKWMRYRAEYPDGTGEVLLSVPHYHFNWQRSYKLASPKAIPRGTRLVVEAAWDNSALNPSNPDPTREVKWGEQSWDEMFFASYQFTANDAKPPADN